MWMIAAYWRTHRPRVFLFQLSGGEPLGIVEQGFYRPDVLPVTQPLAEEH